MSALLSVSHLSRITNPLPHSPSLVYSLLCCSPFVLSAYLPLFSLSLYLITHTPLSPFVNTPPHCLPLFLALNTHTPLVSLSLRTPHPTISYSTPLSSTHHAHSYNYLSLSLSRHSTTLSLSRYLDYV
mmetsp:Transcript_2610/g.8189  ORF Transcript_2610/g.8189 Transcript_2610/m.8189 type:complete len:128 (-) Transcript_2610:118-501(-)